MTPFTLAEFSRLSPRLDRCDRELGQLSDFFARHRGDVLAGDWGAVSAASLGVHNVYNGIEDILMSLARDLDGSAPTGPTLHQDILDQMASELAGRRPALLSPDLHMQLTELKGFRHLVRHKYGFDLKPEKVVDNVERLQHVFPTFAKRLKDLHDQLAERSPSP
ncbi:MAG: hypothetical protein QE484_16955 [Rhizobium sp.]|nr:hypothetical protein [Rhizobium sp.]